MNAVHLEAAPGGLKTTNVRILQPDGGGRGIAVWSVGHDDTTKLNNAV
jgi:hypothetical protein